MSTGPRASGRALAVPVLMMLMVLPVVGVPSATAAADEDSQAVPVFAFEGDRIDESSGLADGGDVLFTVNDSGDGPFVYAVDKATGETVAVTTYADHGVADVEAVAGDARRLWVGDIGDNQRARTDVEVYRLRPAVTDDRAVTADRFALTYPNGPRDAETLLVHPATGRLYVVSKAMLGGTVYAVPQDLRTDRANEMRAVADLPPGLVTDGVFLPDGDHVLLRTYSSAVVYTFPGFDQVATFALPPQRQGEAVTVDGGGHLYVSSEGSHAAVYRLARRASSLTAPAATSRADTGRADDPVGRRVPPGVDLDRPRWLVLLILVVVVGAFGYRVVRAFRRRGRRRR